METTARQTLRHGRSFTSSSRSHDGYNHSRMRDWENGETVMIKLESALTDVGYEGPACVELEDGAFEGSLDSRKTACIISRQYMRQFVQS